MLWIWVPRRMQDGVLGGKSSRACRVLWIDWWTAFDGLFVFHEGVDEWGFCCCAGGAGDRCICQEYCLLSIGCNTTSDIVKKMVVLDLEQIALFGCSGVIIRACARRYDEDKQHPIWSIGACVETAGTRLHQSIPATFICVFQHVVS
jgi:hypothetical protein